MTNKEFFIQCWQDETKTTAKAIRALPADMSKLEYKPNAKARFGPPDYLPHFAAC